MVEYEFDTIGELRSLLCEAIIIIKKGHDRQFGTDTPNQWHDDVSPSLANFYLKDFKQIEERKKYAEEELRQYAKRLGFSIKNVELTKI